MNAHAQCPVAVMNPKKQIHNGNGRIKNLPENKMLCLCLWIALISSKDTGNYLGQSEYVIVYKKPDADRTKEINHWKLDRFLKFVLINSPHL